MSKAINQLAALRRSFPNSAEPLKSGRLKELEAFGSNPGALRALYHRPADLPGKAPLVVVLHGCTQSAANYDHGSQWSDLADRHGFAVLFPEQTRSNNMNLCFNWFEPGDFRRGQGEALSISQMVRAMTERFEIDESRVFITGLSAGGAMTSAMLASYPEMFAGGAIIAGLPYGTASGIPQALERMRGQGGPKGPELAKLIPGSSSPQKKWPAVSIWHGNADHTVDVSNARDIGDQWRGVHGVGTAPDIAHLVDGHPYRAWRGKDGRVVVEEFIVAGMGHGTPLDSAAEFGGRPGPHMLDVGLSSTKLIARTWDIAGLPAETRASDRSAVPSAHCGASAESEPRPSSETPTASPEGYISDVIGNALRAAGLMR